MYSDLYEYLLLHRHLSIPGVGGLELHRTAASSDFAQKQVKPPAFSIRFQPNSPGPSRKLFDWLAGRLNISSHEAIMKFNGFAYDLKSQVMSGKKVSWQRVGEFSRGYSGEIKFESALDDKSFDRPVNAIRVIRDKAVHSVRVGDEERTSAEMADWLHPEDRKRSYGWIIAMVAAILLVIFLAVYFFQQPAAGGNRQKISPSAAGETYKTMP